MAGLRIDIRDVDGLGRRLSALSAEDLSDIVTATVNEIATNAKAATPVGKVNGGTLLNSIRTEVSGSEGRVGYVAKYAPHVEYGHRQTPGRYVPAIGKRLKASYVPGQHFFKPVVERERTAFQRRVQEAVSEAMR